MSTIDISVSGLSHRQQIHEGAGYQLMLVAYCDTSDTVTYAGGCLGPHISADREMFAIDLIGREAAISGSLTSNRGHISTSN